MIRFFPYAVAVLELGAAAVYFYSREFKLGVVWTCYAASAALLGSMK